MADDPTDQGKSDHVKQPASGRLLADCRIDLPPDDVIEEVEFERFFRLNLLFGDLQGPAVLNLRPETGTSLAAADNGERDADEETTAPEGTAVGTGHVPLSDDPEAWARVSRGAPGAVALAEADAITDPLDVRSLPLAIYMPFTQQWKLEGYTRGRVVNSFSLGPGEEQTVEVFTWDRLRSSFESSTSFESEETTESSSSRRDAVDVSRDVSRQAGFELTSGGKVGFTVGVVNADVSAGMTARAGVNDAERNTRGLIVEATSRSTSRVRSSRTLKVTESRESGREERITRKLRNPNACHTLTVPFFEVLANHRVVTFIRAPEVRLVVLLRSSQLTQLRGFDRRTIRAHETALRLALLDRELETGFPAARLLDARDRACGILCEGCKCDDDAPTTVGSREWVAVETAARSVGDAVNTLRSQPVRFPASIPEALLGLASGTGDVKRYLFIKSVATHAPRLLLDLAAVGITGGSTPVSVAQVEALARVLAAVPAEVRVLLRFDDSVSTSVYWEIYAFVFATITHEPVSAFIPTNIVRANTADLKIYDDANLLNAIANFAVAYDAWVKAEQAERQRNEKLAELARIAKEEREVRILESFGLQETASAEERIQALLDHLNDPRNIDHYRFAIWNERSGAADDAVTSLALAGWVDPTPVGIVGDQLALPVRLDREQRLAAFFTDSIADLIRNTVRDERRHILPTAALYAESIVGECCACEEETVERRRLETGRVELDNQLVALEARRLKARLDAKPPLLDKELSPASRVDVTIHRAPGGDGGDGRGAAGNGSGEPGKPS